MAVDISYIREGRPLTLGQQTVLTARLAVPAIIAQLSTILMQYIDSSMVGRLGADQSASVGLMNSSLWMFWGVCSMVTMGFSVQVAHRLGAKDEQGARAVLRQGITSCVLFGVFMALLGVAIAPWLPGWLGGTPDIRANASLYFMVFVSAMPVLTMNYLAGGMLRCAGNMKVPGMLNVLMCVLDVIFNFFLIFPTRELNVLGLDFTCPGAGLGVLGAALGTVSAECITAAAMAWYLLRRQKDLHLSHRDEPSSFRPTRNVLKKASKIAVPMTLEHVIFCGAQILITIIVAPLGVVAIAANAFAVTAESLCYMPGFGIGDAATTLAGQSYGAGRYELVRRFTYLTVGLGMGIMTLMGVVMYLCAPMMMGIMSPVQDIVDLGAEVLRIEAWAEPMYAASIVAYGAMVGVGDTTLPAIMNFGSMWLVRIPLAAILAPRIGLRGVWIAMCLELTFRGVIFLWRMFGRSWLKPERKPDADAFEAFEDSADSGL
ncbi:MAG: MATE family efflux transporter [Muribaculaceae bacterium]|nr:MATE family efflux transporter [Muribaculaceae bacterium]